MIKCSIIFLLTSISQLAAMANTIVAEHRQSVVQDSSLKGNPDCEKGIKVTYAPAVPSQKFANIYGDNDIAITSFVAKCSRLKEVYIWVNEESGGLIGAQIAQGGPYGQVIAVGSVAGRAVGKQRVDFSNAIYLEEGKTYYLKLFKGEPATIRGSVARAAQNSDDIQGYHVYGPLSYDLAHELVFDKWKGTPPANVLFDERKKLPGRYEVDVNKALHANIDLFGEELLKLPAGPTYDNIKDYLTPLKLIGTAVTESGVYYIPFGRPANLAGYGPVALHLGDGSQIISQVSTGTKTTIFVGAEGLERYGFAEARLAQEHLEDGYQPILINEYTDLSGVKYIQESFSDYSFATTELVSFIKITVRKENAKIDKVKLGLLFSDSDLVLEGNVLKSGGKVRALLAKGGKLTGGNKITYELDLSQGDQELYFARLLHPADCILNEIDARYYDAEKTELKQYWNNELAKGATFEVPEERVNNARKNLLVQNLYMGYLYSIGNVYQTWYQPEGNDAARVMGEYGHMSRQKAIHDVLLSVPLRKYRTWEIGELLSHSAQYYHISKDSAFIHQHLQKFISYLADFEKQMNASANGVLNAEAFSGDIAEKLVYLHHQGVAWRGMRDMAYIIKSFGEASRGDKYLSLADSLRIRLLRALNESKTILPDSSIFLPTELFTKKKPVAYPKITETKYGSYWNLCFPYVAGSGLLDKQLLSGYYKYLKNHGAFFLGMVRFNYYPVQIGNYYRDGLPGYKTPGVDNVYGLNVSRMIAIMDDPDRLVLSMYAKLAHGMTRNTFISGEGDTIGPYPDEYYRTSYLSPSSFNNSWFLEMLRLMLIAETDGKNGLPEKLHLAYSTPRAWLAQGKQIKVADAPTLFGKIGYVIDSDIQNGRINIAVSLPAQIDAAEEVSIRLRVPDKKKIQSVSINGAKHKKFDAGKETIDLTGKRGSLNVLVRYQ
jgi:muconolactone delta-isomerase